MTTYFKAIRPNGRDFYSDSVQWAPECVKAREGRVVKHPTATEVGRDASGYLSVSTVPTDCTGMAWPCRLLEVETVDGSEPVTPDKFDLPNKRAAVAWRVVREVDPTQALGPQGVYVAALIERAGRLTRDESRTLAATPSAAWDAAGARDAWVAAWVAAWDAAAARDAARYGAWAAARDVARDAGAAAWDAAWALVVRDLISQEHYDALTRPWRSTVGPLHPDDKDLRDGQ